MANYILNMGGLGSNGYSDTVDVFRATANGVEVVTGHGLTLSSARWALAAASCGNYILAMGGYGSNDFSDEIDVFRTTDSGVEAVTGHNLTLSMARESLAAASCGNYILAMGGSASGGDLSNAIDIFRVTANGVEAVIGHGLTLSTARENLVAASCGNYILAMGGYGSGGYSDAVDVFRATDNGVEAVTGHGLTLSMARESLAAASCGNYILAMGGSNYGGATNAVDVFKVTDNGVEAVTGHNLTLSTARENLVAASCGNYILAMGGSASGGDLSNAIDIFRVTDNGVEAVTDHGLTLSMARRSLAAASVGNYILAMGGYGASGAENSVDVFQAF